MTNASYITHYKIYLRDNEINIIRSLALTRVLTINRIKSLINYEQCSKLTIYS